MKGREISNRILVLFAASPNFICSHLFFFFGIGEETKMLSVDIKAAPLKE
jgi:hypothetical protein